VYIIKLIDKQQN